MSRQGYLQVRVTDEERAHVEQAAAAAGYRSVSAYVRDVALSADPQCPRCRRVAEIVRDVPVTAAAKGR